MLIRLNKSDSTKCTLNNYEYNEIIYVQFCNICVNISINVRIYININNS